MSKYTTEVRYICENACGYTESKGADLVDPIVSQSWDKIFTSKFPIYDEEYRPVLCQKILKHFYLREICCETVGIWKLWLNERMEMIMPFYNQLYESALLKFNPLYDVDLDTTGNKNTDYGETTSGNSNSNYTRTDNLKSKRTDNLTSESDQLTYNLYSDTPQGALNGVDNENYLTDARKVTDHNVTENTGTQEVDNTGTQNNSGTETTNGTKNFNNLNEYSEHVTGKTGGKSYSILLNEFRETFLNIDLLICDELEDLFIGLW